MPATADRCHETANNPGAGAVTTTGAVAGFRTWAAGLGSSAISGVPYLIEEQTAGAWEVGYGTFNGTTGLTRDMILSSSNANALVTFAGAVYVSVNLPSDMIQQSTIGVEFAIGRCAYFT